jgi:hypothetical protein
MLWVPNQFGHLLDLIINRVMFLHKYIALRFALLDQIVAHVDILFDLLHEQVLRVLLYELIEAHLRLRVAAEQQCDAREEALLLDADARLVRDHVAHELHHVQVAHHLLPLLNLKLILYPVVGVPLCRGGREVLVFHLDDLAEDL